MRKEEWKSLGNEGVGTFFFQRDRSRKGLERALGFRQSQVERANQQHVLFFIKMKNQITSFPHAVQPISIGQPRTQWPRRSLGDEPVRMGSGALVCRDWGIIDLGSDGN